MTTFSRSIVKEYSVTWAVIFAALLMIVFVTQAVRYMGYAGKWFGTLWFGILIIGPRQH
jgi:lipopolysaccharide export LptBFGC system permease protein LptF